MERAPLEAKAGDRACDPKGQHGPSRCLNSSPRGPSEKNARQRSEKRKAGVEPNPRGVANRLTVATESHRAEAAHPPTGSGRVVVSVATAAKTTALDAASIAEIDVTTGEGMRLAVIDRPWMPICAIALVAAKALRVTRAPTDQSGLNGETGTSEAGPTTGVEKGAIAGSARHAPTDPSVLTGLNGRTAQAASIAMVGATAVNEGDRVAEGAEGKAASVPMALRGVDGLIEVPKETGVIAVVATSAMTGLTVTSGPIDLPAGATTIAGIAPVGPLDHAGNRVAMAIVRPGLAVLALTRRHESQPVLRPLSRVKACD